MSSKAKVFLPKTTFLDKVKGTERAARDANLAKVGKIGEFYQWQQNRLASNNTKSFCLLDGPPYANGQLHVGHAINKILKDFIVRSKVATDGCRVLFRPGWDCHGLPIELKIKKDTASDSSEPLKIQEKAGEVARSFIQSQMETFKKWGVSADWGNYYYTMDRQYIVSQLRIFANIYENGYVFRSYKPVYWSPSSKTALAESELVYKDGFKCKSVYFRFQVLNFDKANIAGLDDLPTSTSKNPVHVYALIWTTTPWNLPMNNAIAYSSSFQYSAIEIVGSREGPIREIYIVASECVENLKKTLGKDIRIFGTFAGSALQGLFYRSQLHNELALPFLSSNHVKKSKGTGLVHTSYAHGLDDYSPVLIRSSEQWFFDVSSVGRQCAEKVSSNEIEISVGRTELREKLINQLVTRPFWCISRQRVWGVPIPYLVDKSSGEAKTSAEFIRFVADIIVNNAQVPGEHPSNIWWKVSVEDLLKHECCPKDFSALPSANYKKGTDIMDVWLDSGVAWHTTLLDGLHKPKHPFVDVVLEGEDQFEGWFQTSLLTSVAANGVVPFKKILVHGMAHDDQGRKMSKSVGNVVSPEHVTDGSNTISALGVDGLRFWVASSCGSLDAASISKNALKAIEQKLYVIRRTLKYLLGVMDNMERKEVAQRYILLRLRQHLCSIQQKYRNYQFNRVASDFFDFLGNPLSSLYVNCLRDRMYCHSLGSQEHDAALFTFLIVGHRLVGSIAPILPHLAVEFFEHHPFYKDEVELATRLTFDDLKLNDEWIGDELHLNRTMGLVFQIREKLNIKSNRDLEMKGLVISVSDEGVFDVLAKLYRKDDPSCELIELLGVSYILVEKSDPSTSGVPWEVRIIEPPEDRAYCPRCRKMNRIKEFSEALCLRCSEAVTCF